jgi:hypothetical protein
MAVMRTRAEALNMFASMLRKISPELYDILRLARRPNKGIKEVAKKVGYPHKIGGEEKIKDTLAALWPYIEGYEELKKINKEKKVDGR